MCGIAGLYDRSGDADSASVEAMTHALRHRGPDGRSVWFDRSVCLGHTRLKILDLTEAASQPMTSEDGAVTLVYNGEVYNYVELRAELEAAGRTFRSTGDTEVVLAAYLEWGVACFERFNGMFALGLWDKRTNKLVLARDQFGIKPLYLRRLGRALAFASEPTALTTLAPVSPDEDIVADYLARALVDHQRGRTFLRDIERLEPGTVLTLDDGGERRTSFWTLEGDPAVEGLAAAELEERLRAIFLDSVRLRLRSDVRLGTCLSGGVDSSAVVGALKELDATNLEAFTAWADGPGLDERRYATAAADNAGIRSRTIKTNVELVDAELDATVRAQGEPFSSASMVVQRCVMRLAHEHGVTVILDGQGGDELFAGYPGSFGPAVLDRFRERGVRAGLRELRAIERRHQIGPPGLVADALRPLAPAPIRDLLRRQREQGLSRLRVRPLERTRGRAAPYLASQRRMLLERRGLPALLRYEDRNSMAFSLEARLPFLDPRLVRFAFALPSSELVRDGETKWILRRALAPLLPSIVRTRRDKVGFAAPEREWLAGPGYARARDVLGDPATRRHGYIDVDRALRLLERHRTGAVDASRPLWRAVNLELWLNNLPS